MAKMNKKKLALVLGILFAGLHAIWALAVAMGIAEKYINWIMPLHFISLMIPITSFEIGSALLLVLVAFLGGYVTGWLFALVWNWIK